MYLPSLTSVATTSERDMIRLCRDYALVKPIMRISWTCHRNKYSLRINITALTMDNLHQGEIQYLTVEDMLHP